MNVMSGLVEQFIELQKSKAGWLTRLFRNYPEVTSTRMLARPFSHPAKKPEEIIKPSLLIRLIDLVFVAFGLFMWLIFLKVVVEQPGARLFAALLLAFASFWLSIPIRSLVSRKVNFIVRVNAAGIGVRHEFIQWVEIIETAVMTKPEGKGESTHLIIFLRDGSHRDLNVKLSGIGKRRLATLVEQYKTMGQPSTH